MLETCAGCNLLNRFKNKHTNIIKHSTDRTPLVSECLFVCLFVCVCVRVRARACVLLAGEENRVVFASREL